MNRHPMSKRAVIYARFSTDLQDERSIEDQVALCRDYARRESLHVIEVFEDRARSGASILNRDGLLTLMERAKSNGFDVVIVEALDRLSRDMEDLAGIHKRLTYRGIQIRAVHEGVVNTVLVGLRGLVGQLYREDGAAKIRRGMSGRVRDGLAGGGIQYGYAPVAGERGKRTIVESKPGSSAASSQNETETTAWNFGVFFGGLCVIRCQKTAFVLPISHN
jgi:site-specific DNA recombinase